MWNFFVKLQIMENKMKRSFRNIILLMTVTAVFSALVSCSKNDNNSSSVPENTDSFEFNPAGEIIEGRRNIYAVLKVITGDYWEGIVEGLTDAGNEFDCNVYIGGSKTEAEWNIQEQMLDEACERGADAIIFAPANSSQFAESADRIHSENIPLILIDTMLTSGYYDVCYMTDNFQAGQLAAEELISMLSEAGYDNNDDIQVAIQITTRGSQTVVDRIAGFNKYWKLNSPEKWEIIDDVKFNQGDLDIAIQNGRDFIADYPDLKVMAGFNNSSSVGFATAINESGRNDIILSAFDYSKEVAGIIADKDRIASTVVQKQYDMGYKGVRSALDILDGQEVDCKFVDTGVIAINERNYREYEEGK